MAMAWNAILFTIGSIFIYFIKKSFSTGIQSKAQSESLIRPAKDRYFVNLHFLLFASLLNTINYTIDTCLMLSIQSLEYQSNYGWEEFEAVTYLDKSSRSWKMIL